MPCHTGVVPYVQSTVLLYAFLIIHGIYTDPFVYQMVGWPSG